MPLNLHKTFKTFESATSDRYGYGSLTAEFSMLGRETVELLHSIFFKVVDADDAVIDPVLSTEASIIQGYKFNELRFISEYDTSNPECAEMSEAEWRKMQITYSLINDVWCSIQNTEVLLANTVTKIDQIKFELSRPAYPDSGCYPVQGSVLGVIGTTHRDKYALIDIGDCTDTEVIERINAYNEKMRKISLYELEVDLRGYKYELRTYYLNLANLIKLYSDVANIAANNNVDNGK